MTAEDNAGNTASTTVAYRVVWPLAGLFQPVDNPPVVNTVAAGKVVPARFSLGGYRGSQVFATGYPQTQPVTCPGRARTDEIEQTLPGSAASLTYRNGVYTYAWRSQKAWASRTTCRRLVLKFRDGQQRTALVPTALSARPDLDVRRPKTACRLSVRIPRLDVVPPKTAPTWLPLAAVGCTLVFWASAFVAIRHLGDDFSRRRPVARPPARGFGVPGRDGALPGVPRPTPA